MVDDADQRLRGVLADILGRTLRTPEIVSALGLSRSGYYLAREKGRLLTADHLLRLASSLDINPVQLLVRCGVISAEDIRNHTEKP